MSRPKALSLFSSAGIGDLGLRANGIEIVASSELLEDRHALFKRNYPGTKSFTGDIWSLQENITDYISRTYGEAGLFLIYATPPCQGMSSNGIGRLKHEVRQGTRSPVDQRNRLIIPTMRIISRLRPTWVLLENVPGMRRTAIEDESGRLVNIMDHIEDSLGDEYVGRGEVVCCSQFGVPQLRKRLITIFTRDPAGVAYFKQNGGSFFAAADRSPPTTLREAIGHLPPLEAKTGRESASAFHEFHRVPVLKAEKHWWISNTAEGDTAYNNQCCNPKCKFQDNPLHTDVMLDGRWQSNKNTPVHCSACGELLPRPSMIDKTTGQRRLIKGFHSAYRRMIWDQPSRALTKNYIYEASDNKIHPDQNRVLSMLEALIIQTIDKYDYSFAHDSQAISTNLFAEIIGESVPPALIDMLCKKLLLISNNELCDASIDQASQAILFD